MGKSLDRLKELATGRMSSWHEEAKWYRENNDWLKRSSKIAFRILSELDKKGLSQKELAFKMGVSPQYVSKIVKGKENLSLETISKIEDALGISIISVNSYSSNTSVHILPEESLNKKAQLSETRSSVVAENNVSKFDSQTSNSGAA